MRTNPPPDAETLEHFPRLARGERHPRGWAFPEIVRGSGCGWLDALRELYGHPVCFPASISPEGGLLLHALVRALRPRCVVEVGTYCSVSTHWIASALAETGCASVVHCFDDFSPIRRMPWCDAEMLGGRFEFVRDRLARAGLLGMVRFHRGDSSANLRNLPAELRGGPGVDFAFIDGNHTVGGALADFIAAERTLEPGGCVLLHDTNPGQCGGHLGPRFILDHVRPAGGAWSVSRPLVVHPRLHALVQAAQARRSRPVGRGSYERMDLHTAPLNYGMGLLRRVPAGGAAQAGESLPPDPLPGFVEVSGSRAAAAIARAHERGEEEAGPTLGLLLFALACNLRPGVVVDAGGLCAVSALWVAWALAPRGGSRLVVAPGSRAAALAEDAGLSGVVDSSPGGVDSGGASGRVQVVVVRGDDLAGRLAELERSLATGGYVFVRGSVRGGLESALADAGGRYDALELSMRPEPCALLRRLA